VETVFQSIRVYWPAHLLLLLYTLVLAHHAGALYAACLVPAIFLGLWWRRGDGTAVLASIAVGVLVPDPTLDRLFR
jgi:Na+/proline symporter